MKNFIGVPKIVQGQSDNEYIIRFENSDGPVFYTGHAGFVAIGSLYFDLELFDQETWQRLKEEVLALPIPWSVDVAAQLEQALEKLVAAEKRMEKMDETITSMAARLCAQGEDVSDPEISEAEDPASPAPISTSFH